VHRYVSVRDIRGRGETELQEFAWSNRLSGNVWTPSYESTDRTWSSLGRASRGLLCSRSPVFARVPAGGSSGANAHRGRSAHRGSGRCSRVLWH
jgi:hypothetical protein